MKIFIFMTTTCLFPHDCLSPSITLPPSLSTSYISTSLRSFMSTMTVRNFGAEPTPLLKSAISLSLDLSLSLSLSLSISHSPSLSPSPALRLSPSVRLSLNLSQSLCISASLSLSLICSLCFVFPCSIKIVFSLFSFLSPLAHLPSVLNFPQSFFPPVALPPLPQRDVPPFTLIYL